MDGIVGILWYIVPKVGSTRWILKHWTSNCCKVLLSLLQWTSLDTLWASISLLWTNICRLLSKERTCSCGWNRVESLLRHASGWYSSCLGDCRACNCWEISSIVATWPRVFTHLLHLFHVWESLGCWVESICWVFSQERFLLPTWLLIQKCLMHSVNRESLRVLTSFLEGQPKRWLRHVWIGCVKLSSSCPIQKVLGSWRVCTTGTMSQAVSRVAVS